MKRRSLFTSLPPVALGAAGAFGAGRFSNPGATEYSQCGSGGNGGKGVDGVDGGKGVDGGSVSQLPGPPERPERPDAQDPPAPPRPETAPRLVAPLPTPTEAERVEAERAWQQEWLDLVTRPAGKPASGC
jgi:hypothetical protein